MVTSTPLQLHILPTPPWRTEHFVAGDLALELSNTISHRRDNSLAEDRLASHESLRTWFRSVTGLQKVSVGASDLRDTRLVRQNVHSVFDAIAQGTTPPSTSIAALLRTAATRFGEDERALGPIASELAWAAICALATLDHSRIRSCPACGWLFVDSSKGARRRWCAMATCGTRAKVAAFRAREAGDNQ